MKHNAMNESNIGGAIGWFPASTSRSPIWMMATMLFVALVLTLLPMSQGIAFFRPAWVLLVLIFWALVLSERTSITLAWIVGVLLDVLHGTLLGEHAFALTVVVYIAARFCHQIRMFSLFQQGISVFFMVLFYQFILFCIQGFLGDLPEGWRYWLPSCTSMLLWPWIFTMMRDWHRRFD